ncbi:MAG: ADOP family duplicated permease [Longimicrobiales bacterium]
MFRSPLRDGDDVAREVEEEIEAHLTLRVDELMARGMSEAEARAEAERRFGDRDLAWRRLHASVRAREYRLRWLEWLGSVRGDVVLALRRARQAPGSSAVTLAILALGIGLTTAGFTVVDHVLIRALPYPDPDRLVALQGMDSTMQPIAQVSEAMWRDWRESGGTLAASAIHMEREWSIDRGDGAFHVPGQLVSPGFFEVLRSRFVAGRGFTTSDRFAPNEVIVSEGFWRDVMGAPTLPQDLVVEQSRRQVIGVVASSQEHPLGTRVYVPNRESGRVAEAYNWINWAAIGRLRPDVTLARAASELSAVARGASAANPEALYFHGTEVVPLREVVVSGSRTYLLLLMGGALFLLLVACANLAAVAFARTAGRGSEIAVRSALGAGRLRVVRQLLTEHLVLGLAGGALGVGLAWVLTRITLARAGELVPRAAEVSLDTRVLGFALVVAILSGVAAGLAPAIRASGTSLRSAIGGARDPVHGGRGLPGAGLVVVQITVAVVLLTAGALLVRSFRSLLARDIGFDTERVLTATTTLSGERYAAEPERQVAYRDRILERLAALPGVQAAGFANWIPTGSGGTGFIEIEGRGERGDGAGYRVISDDYLRALGVPLLVGRGFDERDRSGTQRVALINRAMRAEFWPDADPVGRRVRALSMESWGDTAAVDWITIVGVVGDMRHWGYEDPPQAEMYTLYRQVPLWATSMTAVIRAAPGVEPAALAPAVRRVFRGVDPSLAVGLATLEQRLGELTLRRRFVMSLLSAFGALALLLAAVGIYGLLAYAVAQRTKEIGLRAALGADRARIVRLMLGGALRVVAVGLVAGAAAALALTRLIRSMLVDVTPHDPVALLAAAALLMLVAGAAALLPAWRASRIDALVALREG